LNADASICRDNPARNRTCTRHCLPSSEDNPICLVKIILIHALRIGNVDGTNIEEVLAKANRRRDKTVIWKRGDLPLVAALCNFGTGLDLSKPAAGPQVSNTISRAGLLAGILGKLRSHDMRYGSAADLAYMKDGTLRPGLGRVAAELNHSHKALTTGITRKYAGDSSVDSWSKRAQENHRDLFDLQIAESPYPNKRPLSTDEITTLCDIEGVDSSDPRARQRVSMGSKRQAISVWMEGEKDAVDAPSPEQSPNKGTHSCDRSLRSVKTSR